MGAIASHLWQSTLVAAVAAVLTWFLRNNAASVRFWIWFAASMKFLVPFAAVSAVTNVLPLPGMAASGGDALAVVNRVFSASAAPAISPALASAIVVVWLAGTMVLAARWLREWNRTTAIAREAEPVSDGPVLDSLRRLECAVGIRTPLAIVCSQHKVEPGIVGIRTPVLVWPQHLSAGLRHDQIEPVLAHELAHVIRRDNLLASLHMLVGFAFWFHPIVWWIGRRLVEERERACDEHVLGLGQSASTYAAAILKTCELCIASPLVNVSGVTGGHLKKRIARIVEKRVGEPLDFARRAVVAIVAFVVLAMPITAGACSRRKPLPVSETPPGVERAGPNIEMPKLVREVRPHYTPRAMQDKIEGEVLMECVVRTDGTPSDFRILKSLDPDLDQAAIAAARQWEFEPGKRGGRPVPVMVTVTIAFTLK